VRSSAPAPPSAPDADLAALLRAAQPRLAQLRARLALERRARAQQPRGVPASSGPGTQAGAAGRFPRAPRGSGPAWQTPQAPPTEPDSATGSGGAGADGFFFNSDDDREEEAEEIEAALAKVNPSSLSLSHPPQIRGF